MDRISRLPIQDAERLIDQIRAKGARLLVPGIIDFSDIIDKTDDTMSKYVKNCFRNNAGASSQDSFTDVS